MYGNRERATLLTLLLLNSTAVAFAKGPKIAPDAQNISAANINPDGTVDVIVQFNSPVPQQQTDVVSRHGGKAKKDLPGLGGGAFHVPESAINDLASEPSVSFISLDHKLQAHSAGAQSAAIVTSGVVNAPTAWSLGYNGAGVGVAVIDSGINAQVKDLGDLNGSTDKLHSRVVYAENFLVPALQSDGKPNPARQITNDQYGHGTHVAGIIAGNGFLSTGPQFTTTYLGVAPQANLIDLQVLDQNGQGSDSLVIEAIDRAIALQSQYNIRVINLSLGRPVYTSFTQDPLCQEVEKAWHAGIVVVVAAGNDGRDNSFGSNGYGTITAPGNDPRVLTVGAMKSMGTDFRLDDQIATYSSRGPSMVDHIVKPDLVAPGNIVASLADQKAYLLTTYPSNIVSPYLYEGNANQGSQSSYFNLSGTSMATAVASGAVAALLSGQPQLTPDQVKARLMLTASKEFRTYTPDYYATAARLQPLVIEAAQEPALVASYQSAVTSVSNQVQAAAAKVTADQKTVAQDQLLVNADLSTVAADNSSVAPASAKVNDAMTAYKAALAAQATADAALAQAKASHAGGEILQPLKQADTTARQATATLLQALQAAQAVLQAAQSLLQQDRQRLSADQAVLKKDTAQLNIDQALLATSKATLATAQQKLADAKATQATLDGAVAQLSAAENDPNQYSPAQYDVFTVGAGYLDLAAAVQSTAAIDSGAIALSPAAYIDPATNVIRITDNYQDVCSAQSISGATAVWGSTICGVSTVWGTTTVWGSTAVWGSSTVWGSTAVWGSSTVWGTTTVWGSTAVTSNTTVWGSSTTPAYGLIWGNTTVWGSSDPNSASMNPIQANSILVGGDPN